MIRPAEARGSWVGDGFRGPVRRVAAALLQEFPAQHVMWSNRPRCAQSIGLVRRDMLGCHASLRTIYRRSRIDEPGVEPQ